MLNFLRYINLVWKYPNVTNYLRENQNTISDHIIAEIAFEICWFGIIFGNCNGIKFTTCNAPYSNLMVN